MSPQVILLTGATGFVGGAIALELLARTSAELVCITRGSDEADATQRLHNHLRVAADAYAMPEFSPVIAERCRAVVGDLQQPDCGLQGKLPNVDTVLHCAASLKFADRDEAEIRAVNEGGTQSILKLAEQEAVSGFYHISTAYVAGSRTGLIKETDPLPDAHLLNNAYERSKARAERMVMESPVPAKILRPSIVIGHSRTYAATSFTGMYGMLEELRTFSTKVHERLGNLLSHNGVRILADPSAEVNLVPVDYVASATARIMASDHPAETYHLANTAAPRVGGCLTVGCEAVGLASPRYATTPEQLSALDRRLQTDFYDSYLRNSKVFDMSNTDAVCGKGFMDAELPTTELRSYAEWFLSGGFRRGRRLGRPDTHEDALGVIPGHV